MGIAMNWKFWQRSSVPEAALPPRRNRSLGVSYGGSPGLDGLGVGPLLGSEESAPPSPLATAMAVVKFLSTTEGSLPRVVHERGDLSRKPVRSEDTRHIWGRPSVRLRTSSVSWWTTLFAHLEGWANAYIWLDRIGERVVGMHLLHPSGVHPMREDNQRKVFYLGDDLDTAYTPDQILHIPGLSFDGVKGIPPGLAGATVHEHAMLQERWGKSFLQRGGRPSGVLSVQGEMDAAAAEELQDNWAKTQAGAGNVGGLFVVQGGSEYKQTMIAPDEAQYLESRQYTREEILGLYCPSLPHHLLGWRSNTSNFGTGIEQQGIHLVRYALDPRLRLVADAISEELLPDDLEMSFDTRALLRADTKALAEVGAKMRMGGALTREQWLELAGFPPMDIPDDVFVPKNVERLDAATGEPFETEEPEPVAPPPMMPVPDDQEPPDAPPEEEEAVAFEVVPELRCGNADCDSRSNGRRGALLGRKVTGGEFWCRTCKQDTVLEPRLRRGD